ncbi:shikimate kinase [Geobacter pelophilus]|uniref:Shikimate kinase n=1 Tax=Geoanaerobacter pelophilus TaxID=60036 RepID=A0AAW4KXG1_9BACT|nr:shikimate kinase [Geoanaerobacter pelophilus]MBT0663029.1 shikimate kinase [Geoanaerobacter pelophilus]
MNIVLIGYRGTGKSEVGGILAKRLNMQCLSMDKEIVQRAGMSVSELVNKHGWPGFRDRESAVAADLALIDNLIIDTGGGVIERPENIENLKKNASIFWLKASVTTIVSRIQNCTDRPSLTGGKTFTEEIAEVLDRRTPLYKKSADHEIDTDDLTPVQVAEKIIAFLGE